MKYQAPRGTHDITPPTSGHWQAVERVFSETVSTFGYQEIRTPMFEDTELFTRTSGETSDIVSKQMYQFTDKGGRDITLKPEGTAPAVRSYLENRLGDQSAVTRLWYFTPVFRYERPQKGRFRQHHQLGLECLGSRSPLADAEVIEVAISFYRSLGLSQLLVSLNCIGRAETRSDYREAILTHAASYLSELESSERARAERNPLRLLDSKDPKAIETMAAAPSILDFLEADSASHFASVRNALEEASIPYELAPEIVRGLDYYTDTVFEIKSTALGAQSALCGGGRYDNLVREIGGPDTPAVGFGMGVERLMLVLESHKLLPHLAPPDAFLIAATESARAAIRGLARALRLSGLAALHDLDGKNLKGQFKQADRAAAKWAVIIGDDELSSQSATLKKMATGEQRSVAMEAVAEAIKGD